MIFISLFRCNEIDLLSLAVNEARKGNVMYIMESQKEISCLSSEGDYKELGILGGRSGRMTKLFQAHTQLAHLKGVP